MEDAEQLLINYRALLEKFENNYVNDIFNNYKKYNSHNGYLINLESYESLKNKINAKSYGSISASKILESITKLKPLQIRTSQYLINMLRNENKYIIINTKIWNLLGDKEKSNDSHILYTIDKDLIIFSLDDNIQLKLTCWEHNNIIDELSFRETDNFMHYSKLSSNFEKIDNIYRQINKYYKFEKELISNLNQNKKVQSEKILGYLVDFKWLEKWKEKTNYEELKKNLQIQDNEKNIKNRIIFFEEKNKAELQSIIIKDFRTDNELNNFLKNNSLALVDFDFAYLFGDTASGKSIYYYISKNKLIIEFNFAKLTFPSNNNIITLNKIKRNSDNSNLFQLHLKILINIFYYQEEIKLQISSDYNKYKNEKNEIYFVNKNIMDKLKKFYEYNILSLLLMNQELKSINYSNINNYYFKIFSFIENNNKEYFIRMNKKLSSEKLIIDNEDYNINIKSYNQGYFNIFYLDNFEVLNEEIISSMEKIGIIKQDNIIKGEYLAGDKRIFFCFEKDNKIYYQIDIFDKQTNRFIIEYLIEDLFDYVFKYFKQEGINYFIKRIDRKEIKYGNEIIAKCYKINTYESENQEEIQSLIPLDTDQNEVYIRNIINLLISFALFKSNVEENISISQTLENSYKQDRYICYLVNKRIISEFLDLFWDDNINIVIQKFKLTKNSEIDNSILKHILQDINMDKTIKNKIDIFKQKIRNINFFEIDTTFIKDNNDNIYY